MKLVFLGTASNFPTPIRGVSCTALQLDDGQVWLFDCGEGSQIQIQKSVIKSGKITKIFITHLHGDHLFGLPGLICTIFNGLDEEAIKTKTIELYGPEGIRKFITQSLALSRSFGVLKLSVIELIPEADQYPADWTNIKVNHEMCSEERLPQESSYTRVSYDENAKGWKLFESSEYIVHAAALVHRIPSFAFHIQEASTPGQLDVQKLKKLGLKPGPLYGDLKKGKPVQFNDKTLNPDDFLGPCIPGREIVIFGDTCNSDKILNLTKEPDVFVHEATMQNSLREKCISFGHSTPSMAADIALRSNAKQLVLFHVSPRYKPVSLSVDQMKDNDTSASILLQEAEQYVTSNNKHMQVFVAEDFMQLDINRKKG